MRRFLVAIACLATALVARSASAQQSDIIRGKIVGPDSQPVVNANVNIVDLESGISKPTKTNKDGRYGLQIPNGSGNYMVYITAIGFTKKQFNLKRVADEEILIGDTRLSAATLDRVDVVAQGARQTAGRNSTTTDVSGTDRAVGNSGVAAGDAGNLAAMAASIPGFQLIPGLDGNPDMFSALGLNPDQNGSSLNGASGLGGDLPRDASTSTTIGTNNWDVSIGNVAGASVRTQTRSGTNYPELTNSFQGNAPQLQWTDNVGDALSSEYGRVSLGGRVAGPLKLDRNFYNVSYQYDRRMTDVQNLFNTSTLGLNTGGISQDSVARFRDALGTLGVPIGGSGIPGSQAVDNVRLLGTLDFYPTSSSTGNQIQLSVLGNLTRTAPNATNSLQQTPTANGKTLNTNATATLRYNNYFWDKVASDIWLTGSAVTSKDSPYLRYPTGSVRVASDLDDGTTPIRNFSFGGRPQQLTESSQALVGVVNQMRWFSLNNKHSLKLTTELRYNNSHRDNRFNELGAFSFLSLADLEANRPASYSRQLVASDQDAGVVIGAVSLGDAWRPSQGFQMQYGLRVDANRYTTRPDVNPAVESTFGVTNTNVPNKVYFSPRAGFSWAYGTAPQIPYFEGFRPGPAATLRAGVGVFQNMSGPDLVGSAIANTGLANATRNLICTGPATPLPQWDDYRVDPTGAPTECADGTSPFATSLPSVVLFDKGYKQTSSIRSAVGWRGVVFGNRFTGSVDGTYNLSLHNTSQVDLNFKGEQHFTLASEGNRPVFVDPSAIDPRTGVVASRASRVSTDFNRVAALRSDLRQTTAQLTVGLTPLNYNPTRFTWGVSYTIRDVRDEYLGFSSTVGDPFAKHWGNGGQFAGGRHSINYNFSYNFWDYVNMSWNGSITSGSRYTPTVGGDINGDGAFGNDRAFIFGANASDPNVAAGMQELLANGSSSARKCLEDQVGALSRRGSCVGPWQIQGGSLNFNIQPIKLKLPPRMDIQFSIQNPLAAFDMMFHGTDKIHGWGQPKVLDPTLLVVRGFDAATQAYKYDVNQRFGATDPSQTTQRSPVILTASINLNLGPTRDWTNLKMSLNRGRKTEGNKITEAQLKSTVMNAVLNPMARILANADPLGLSRKQADSLAMLSRGFTLVLDSIWTPVAKYYAGMDTVYRESDAHERFVAGREAAVNYLIKVAPSVKKLLTGSQWRRLGTGITNFLEPRYLERVRAGVASGGLGLPIFF